VKRLLSALVATTAILLIAAAPVGAKAGEGPVTVMVMKHLCNADIKDRADFQAIIDAADSPAAALAGTVLACPTVVNPGDDTSDGVKSDAADFSFTVEDANGVQNMPANTAPGKLCESDLGIDADGDGNIEDDVCLDVSHYEFEGLANGNITVTETDPPSGYAFGELLTTPPAVAANNDADSISSVDHKTGVIKLDTTADEDGMIMLHIYNFQTMPDTATELAPDQMPISAAVLGALALFGGFALLMGVKRQRSAAAQTAR